MAIGDDIPINLSGDEYDEEQMRLDFRRALESWRNDIIDEREEYPNEDEGWGVTTSVAPIKSPTKVEMVTTDTQATTHAKSKVQMVTTNVQHQGGLINDAVSYGPLEPTKIKPSTYKPPKRISCWNWYKIGTEQNYKYDELSKNYYWNEKWIDQYHIKYSLIWPVDQSKFMRTDGVLSNAIWYWSEKCADDNEQKYQTNS